MDHKSFIIVILFALFLTDFGAESQPLPEDEVKSMHAIFEKLHINGISSNEICNSSDVTIPNQIFRNISCGCNGTVCHITNILLVGQNLTGTLDVFSNLRYLQVLDLTDNYISGPIPPAFSKLPLTRMSLSTNRLSGSIPEEIGEITTLEGLGVEGSNLEGPLPKSIGGLSRLKILFLSSNNFTGTIPETFANLKELTQLFINGIGLHGKIPGLIGNWTNIQILDMQGTSMEGPIPDTISQLQNMQELRISDLAGSATTKFPNLREMKYLKILVLRNCKITGPIPDYIGQLNYLQLLDLSLNMLEGVIPGSPLSSNLKYMFLNNNLLEGKVPSWISDSKVGHIDISYNNFSELSPLIGCRTSKLIEASSTSPTESNNNDWCLKKDLPCSLSERYHSLFINCGGNKVTYEGHEYEEDSSREGPSYFFASSQNWAVSSTGTFMYTDKADFVANNAFLMNITGPEFYRTARVAPSSLKYYGLCLRKGRYKVRLYFAEIMFSNDQTFSSLGSRIFDVSIQGNVVLNNFNIVEEAKVAGNGIFRDFDAYVNGSTLEIYLYWSGKGTTAVPQRGVYGPLISAISVKPDFNPHPGIAVGAIIGIVAGSCFFLVLVLILLRRKGCLGGKDHEGKELQSLRKQTGYFTLKQIRTATNHFDPANKIGEGGFGPVYKGVLSDGTIIAVKQLSSKSRQGNREFVNEIGMISALQHPNLVKLYGCCIEGNQLLVIYEYMENNCLARAIFGNKEQQLNLDWPTRKNICLGIARGLVYLHDESRLKIVHRDIKATNVLLDVDLNAKISDFGLAKLDEEENTHISTRIAGTVGYMAPEYATRGYLTDKADVYSFGVVAIEIVSGKRNYQPKEEFVYLLDWVNDLQEQGKLLDLVDPNLGSNYSEKEVLNMVKVGLLCTISSPTLRPSMSVVLSMLEGKTVIPETALVLTNTTECNYSRFRSFERPSQDSGTHAHWSSSSSHVPISSFSTEGPSTDTTFSIHSESEVRDPPASSRLLGDLYDVHLE